MQELEKILEEIKEALEENKVIELNGDGTVNRYIINVASAWGSIKAIIHNHINDGWISVDDKLPEDDVDVLITYADIDDENYTDICITTYGNAYLGGNKLDFKEWRSPFEYFKGNYKVMALLYLPEPYRPERCGGE